MKPSITIAQIDERVYRDVPCTRQPHRATSAGATDDVCALESTHACSLGEHQEARGAVALAAADA